MSSPIDHAIRIAKFEGATCYAIFYTYNKNDGQEVFSVSFFKSVERKNGMLTEIAHWMRWMDTYQYFERPFDHALLGSATLRGSGYGLLIEI